MRMKLKILCAILCLYPGLASAKSAWYEIELIIFVHQSDRYLKTEIWPQEPGSPLRDNALFLVDLNTFQSMGGNNQTMLIKLSQSQLKLRDINKSLAARGSYLPLVHTAWRQLVRGRNQSRPIYLRSPRSLPPPLASPGAGQVGPITNRPINRSGIPILEGTLNLSLGRYLHANFDLIFAKRNPDYLGGMMPASANYPPGAATPTNSGEQPGLNPDEDQGNPEAVEPAPQYLKYRMRQHRRMRTKKLHFIDHPKIGIFIKIMPYAAAAGVSGQPMPKPKMNRDENGLKATPFKR